MERILLDGDAGECAKWLPFARRRLDQISTYADEFFNKTITTADGVLIRLTHTAILDTIYIRAGLVWGYEFLTLRSYSGDFDAQSNTEGLYTLVRFNADGFKTTTAAGNAIDAAAEVPYGFATGENQYESTPLYLAPRVSSGTSAYPRSSWHVGSGVMASIRQHRRYVDTKFHQVIPGEEILNTWGTPLLTRRRGSSQTYKNPAFSLSPSANNAAVNQGAWIGGQESYTTAELGIAFPDNSTTTKTIPLPAWATPVTFQPSIWFNSDATRFVGVWSKESSLNDLNNGDYLPSDMGIIEHGFDYNPDVIGANTSVTIKNDLYDDYYYWAADYLFDKIAAVRCTAFLTGWIGDMRALAIYADWHTWDGVWSPRTRRRLLWHGPFMKKDPSGDTDELGEKYELWPIGESSPDMQSTFGYQYWDGTIDALDLKGDGYCISVAFAEDDNDLTVVDWMSEWAAHGATPKTKHSDGTNLFVEPVINTLGSEFNKGHAMWVDEVVRPRKGFLGDVSTFDFFWRSRMRTYEYAGSGKQNYFGGMWTHRDGHYAIYIPKTFASFNGLNGVGGTGWTPDGYAIDEIHYKLGEEDSFETSHLEIVNVSRGTSYTYDDGNHAFLAANATWGTS